MRSRLLALSVLLVSASATTLAQDADGRIPGATLGKAASFRLEGDWARIEAGSPLFREPDAASGTYALVEVTSELPVLERREGWVRVRYQSFAGWFSPSAIAAADGASLPGPAERILAARERFHLEPAPEPLGSFDLLTDVKDRDALARLSRIARHLPSSYTVRFGLRADSAERLGTVLLFSEEQDYRAFAAAEPVPVSSDFRSHAASGLAALFVGDESDQEVEAQLVHELTHLLNRHTFRKLVSPWLEEGLANDLAFCELDSNGRPRLGSLGGRIEPREWLVSSRGAEAPRQREIRLTGALASLSTTQESWRDGRKMPVGRLMALSWIEFTESEDLALRYGASAFLVRFLLDGGGPDLAAGFRSFLHALSTSDSADNHLFERHLGTALPDLDRRFAKWIESRRLR